MSKRKTELIGYVDVLILTPGLD